MLRAHGHAESNASADRGQDDPKVHMTVFRFPRQCFSRVVHRCQPYANVNGKERSSIPEDSPGKKIHDSGPSRWRWVILTVLSIDICVSYIPYYAFVPIPKQTMQVYSVDEAALNVLCIVYALVYIPAAFVTGPIVAGVGCRWTFVGAMALECIGCMVRCGPGMSQAMGFQWRDIFFWKLGSLEHLEVASGSAPVAGPSTNAFLWLVVGQALCAIGQPLLVNATSEMGVEWFEPHERPTAAMVSNLMNFVGGSLSFVLPPLIVAETHATEQETQQDVDMLLHVHFWIACVGFVMTFLLYRPTPVGRVLVMERAPSTCLTDAILIFKSRDFWLVNGYFYVYISLCHAFDAVEGSLLEHYGYSASITAWTAVSCSVASIACTLLQSYCMDDASSYRNALLSAAAFLALSMFMGWACLEWHMHSGVFVLAVGVMGLATPGWGCSCELGAEVCYPAREATVSSILEAFSNLGGVVSIIVVQWMLDTGWGANVLWILGVCAVFGGVLLLCLSGRLRRAEAEADAAAHQAAQDLEMKQGAGKPAEDGPGSTVDWSRGAVRKKFVDSFPGWLRGMRSTRRQAAVAMGLFICCCYFALMFPRSQLPMDLAVSGGTTLKSQEMLVVPNLTEFPSFVISCGERAEAKLRRFRQSANASGITQFEVVPCLQAEVDVLSAIREGLISRNAGKDVGGRTAKGHARKLILARAITHLRVLNKFVAGNASLCNIFEDTETLMARYASRRTEMLSRMPSATDLVKMNVYRPAGRKMHTPKTNWMHGMVFRMTSSLSPTVNGGLGNYVVTKEGAKKLLQMSKDYDSFGRWESWNQYLLSRIYESSKKGHGFIGFSISTGLLSMDCSSTGQHVGAFRNARKLHCALPDLAPKKR